MDTTERPGPLQSRSGLRLAQGAAGSPRDREFGPGADEQSRRRRSVPGTLRETGPRGSRHDPERLRCSTKISGDALSGTTRPGCPSLRVTLRGTAHRSPGQGRLESGGIPGGLAGGAIRGRSPANGSRGSSTAGSSSIVSLPGGAVHRCRGEDARTGSARGDPARSVRATGTDEAVRLPVYRKSDSRSRAGEQCHLGGG